MKNLVVKPFVKWAGGKTQLLNCLNEKINMSNKRVYIEPFVGAGALFISLLNSSKFDQIIINDINSKLIRVYKTIKKDPKTLIKQLSILEQEYNNLNTLELKKMFFLSCREKFNYSTSLDEVENSALFIFLNKTCFNGLYRENSKGYFNVPFGQKENIKIFDEENILNLHTLLKQKKVKILNSSFEKLKKYINSNTFVYFDPPYRPITNGGFNSYNSSGFNDNMQIKLKQFVDYCNLQSAHIMVSNSDPSQQKSDVLAETDFFDKLYKDYNIQKVYASRMINSNASKRSKISELLITNFK